MPRAPLPPDALSPVLEHLRDDRVGGLLAVPVADTLKQSDGDVDAPRASGTIRAPAMAGANAADVSLRRFAARVRAR